MTHLKAICAASTALGFAIALSLTTNAAAAFGGGGGFHGGGGGFHGGGFGGFHGGFGGGHFGGGHFGGGHFGGMHFGGGHFGHFGGMHFAGRHFGGAHFGTRHFGAAHFGGHTFGGRNFAAGHLGGRNFTAGRLGARNFAGHNFAGRNFAAHGGLGRHMGAVAGFHATRGFNNAGFARNAFGGRGAWRSWNRGWAYGGYGWNGYGWGGWYGPVFWPFFYGDLLSFALWPYDYYDPFWGYGPDFVLASVFWPGPYYDTDYLYGWDENPYAIYGYYGGRTHRGHHARAHEEARTSRTEYQAQAGETCAALAPGITDLPIERIERAIDPNDTQMAILKDLEAASAKANKILEASCPSEPPLTPVTRLDVMGDRIDAMIQAVQTLRAPLTTLDNSLDDKQRERFNAIAFGERRHRARTPSQDNGLAGLCADQSKDFANLPIDQIEQTVKPSGQEQVADFNALKNASAKAARSMDASCPTAMPQTLSDRFNAIVTRLDAMSGAVKTIEPALKTFYASLNDDQKARFNVMAPPNTEQQSEAQ